MVDLRIRLSDQTQHALLIRLKTAEQLSGATFAPIRTGLNPPALKSDPPPPPNSIFVPLRVFASDTASLFVIALKHHVTDATEPLLSSDFIHNKQKPL